LKIVLRSSEKTPHNRLTNEPYIFIRNFWDTTLDSHTNDRGLVLAPNLGYFT